MNINTAVIVSLIYFGITLYLGWLGYSKTKNAADYLVAGRKMHPFLMAMAYGSTFISTSAIVGFGGAAGMFGMGLLWLSFLNIIVGIYIAFAVFGKRTRTIGRILDAHTFPELMGKRFKSKTIQCICGLIIFLSMPLYSAAVMIGGARFLEQAFQMNYNAALFIFAFVVVFYVFFGGLKGIMYTDAFQGSIMLIGMAALLILTYNKLGGIIGAHELLTSMADKVPQKLIDIGHLGWTMMPKFGSEIWWVLVSTIVLGVGIGVLAQPQLVVRYMTVSSARELNRAIGIGGFFIFMMTTVAFIVGSLTNAYFYSTQGKTAIAMVFDQVAGKPNIDKIIPLYISSAMPHWFTYLFLLTLLAAGMSTLSGQFHAIGTSIGRDVFQQIFKKTGHDRHSVIITRIGILIAFIVTVILGYKLPGSIIAIATAIFFGLCAVCFLPMYIGALYSKTMTKVDAMASMFGGLLVWLFWILFVEMKKSSVLGVCQLVFEKPSLAVGSVVASIDPIVIALPVSLAIMLISIAFKKKPASC